MAELSDLIKWAIPGPLNGTIVLDLTRVVAGPCCTMILADMGATVIKIEDTESADYTRRFPPFVQEGEEALSAFFSQYNRNKLGMTLNLRHPEGKALLKQLVCQADILIENFRPGTMEKLGVSADVLCAENPRLVYTAISGFGQTGPYRERPGLDNAAQAAGGIWSMNGYPDRPPVRVGTIIGDLSASYYAAIGTLAALLQARQTGQGQCVDISQQDCVLTLTENAVVRYTVEGEVASPEGNEHPFVRPYGLFPCRDGYVFFGGYSDKFWKITCEIFGQPEMATDPELDTMEKRFDKAVEETRIKPLLTRWFSQYTREELEQMAGARIPVNAVKTVAEVVHDPHIRARNMIVRVPMGSQQIEMFGSPIKLSAMEETPCRAAPTQGEHNEMLLATIGLDQNRIDELRRKGVI